jgi:hypothetical protein
MRSDAEAGASKSICKDAAFEIVTNSEFGMMCFDNGVRKSDLAPEPFVVKAGGYAMILNYNIKSVFSPPAAKKPAKAGFS